MPPLQITAHLCTAAHTVTVRNEAAAVTTGTLCHNTCAAAVLQAARSLCGLSLASRACLLTRICSCSRPLTQQAARRQTSA